MTVDTERAIVVGVGLKSDSFVELKESLVELEELVYTAGAEVVGTVVQTLSSYAPATLIGSGKVNEVKELCKDTEASLVIFDHQLSGIQIRNLEKAIGCRILDRSQLILDIFAQRAQTYEGKLQVELAQMLDMLPRMAGAWMGSLSRQGGGIGTRGPGETALEVDRRRIKDRVKAIRKKLEDVRKHRGQHRSKRKRSQVPSIALIGYTNAGKSTLINRLTHSDVISKDQLFATLDPTTRKIHLPEVNRAVITDTVGFIRNLPAHLIEAFKATLEETAEADVLVHVVDLASDQMDSQVKVVEKLIQDFGWDDKPVLYIYNKMDLAGMEKQFKAKGFPRSFVSAQTGQGIEKLRTLLGETINALCKDVELFFPKEVEHKIYDLGRESSIDRTEASSEGTVCFAKLTPSQMSEWQSYLVKSS